MTRPSAAAARVAHGLALAACFGGTLFGKVAFNPAVGVVASGTERGKVGGNTWRRFSAVNAASFCVAVATWLPGPDGGATQDRRTRGLVLAKDLLLGAAASGGLAALIVQEALYRQAPRGAVPLETGACRPPRRARGLPCPSGRSARSRARRRRSSAASSR